MFTVSISVYLIASKILYWGGKWPNHQEVPLSLERCHCSTLALSHVWTLFNASLGPSRMYFRIPTKRGYMRQNSSSAGFHHITMGFAYKTKCLASAGVIFLLSVCLWKNFFFVWNVHYFSRHTQGDFNIRLYGPVWG